MKERISSSLGRELFFSAGAEAGDTVSARGAGLSQKLSASGTGSAGV